MNQRLGLGTEGGRRTLLSSTTIPFAASIIGRWAHRRLSLVLHIIHNCSPGFLPFWFELGPARSSFRRHPTPPHPPPAPPATCPCTCVDVSTRSKYDQSWVRLTPTLQSTTTSPLEPPAPGHLIRPQGCVSEDAAFARFKPRNLCMSGGRERLGDQQAISQLGFHCFLDCF
jgi:hypothetical protein